jgi:hypothetical protein
MWAIVASVGVGSGFTLAAFWRPDTTAGGSLSAAASLIGSAGSEGCGVESRSSGASVNEALKLALLGLAPGSSFADRGIRTKKLTPKKTAMIQPAISPIDIR